MALSILFLCYNTHQDPSHKGRCIKPYVLIGKITIVAKAILFHKKNSLPQTLFFHRVGGVLGKVTK